MARITSLTDGGEAPAQMSRLGSSATADDEGTDDTAEFEPSDEGSEAPEAELEETPDEESGDSPDDAEATSDEPVDTEDDDAEDFDDGATEDDESSPAEAEIPSEPFRYTYRNPLGKQETVDLPGALFYANGWVGVPPDAVHELSRLVSQGKFQETTQRTETKRLQTELQVARNTVNEDGAKGKAIWDKMIALCTGPVDPVTGDDAQTRVLKFAMNLNESWPKLMVDAQLQIARDYHQRGLALLAGDPAERQAQEMEAFEQRSDDTIMNMVTEIGGSPAYADLSDREIRDLADRLDRTKGVLYVRASEPDPAGRWAKGDLVVNQDYVIQEAQAALRVARARRSQDTRLRKVKDHNGRRKLTRTRPTVGGARDLGNGDQETRRGPRTKEEWEAGIYRKIQTERALSG